MPTAYPSMEYNTKQPNLQHYYFTLLPNLLPYIIPSFPLPLTTPELPRDATYVPQNTSPKGVLSSNSVFTPGLITIKDPTEDPRSVLPTQLYTSIYYLRSSTPHTL